MLPLALLDHRDKTVREEGKKLIIESYRFLFNIITYALLSLIGWKCTVWLVESEQFDWLKVYSFIGWNRAIWLDETIQFVSWDKLNSESELIDWLFLVDLYFLIMLCWMNLFLVWGCNHTGYSWETGRYEKLWSMQGNVVRYRGGNLKYFLGNFRISNIECLQSASFSVW